MAFLENEFAGSSQAEWLAWLDGRDIGPPIGFAEEPALPAPGLGEDTVSVLQKQPDKEA